MILIVVTKMGGCVLPRVASVLRTKMKTFVLIFVVLGLTAFIIPSTEALFGLGRKKKDKRKEEEAAKAIDPTEAVNMGMETMMKQMSDPETLQQTLKMMQDPGRQRIFILDEFHGKMDH